MLHVMLESVCAHLNRQIPVSLGLHTEAHMYS